MNLPSATREKSVGDLFSDLASEASTLVRQEVGLAVVELKQKATYAGSQVGYVATGMILAAVSLLALSASLALGLARFLPLWTSALLVGLAIGVAAYVTAQKGLSALKNMNPELQQTRASMEENKRWALKQIQ